jgi:hypothetical protein
MRRLEYQQPKVRCVSFQTRNSTRNSAEAILFLAQIVRERRRLEQERTSLLKRIGRIDLRLDEIGSTETKIVPVIKVASEPDAPPVEPNVPPKVAVRSSGMARQQTLPTGFTEFTLKY